MSKFVGGFLRVESRCFPGGQLRESEHSPTIDEIANASIEAFDIFGPAIEEILQKKRKTTPAIFNRRCSFLTPYISRGMVWAKQNSSFSTQYRNSKTGGDMTTKEIMDFKLYKATRLLANVVFGCIAAEKARYLDIADARIRSLYLGYITVEDRRMIQLVSPYHYPTESGLFLECEPEDMPSAVRTPCGQWIIVGSCYEGVDGDIARRNLMKNITSRIGITLHSECQNDRGNITGHIYAVHEIGGYELPEPKVLLPRERISPQFVKTAEETWCKHTARYFEEMSQK